MPRILTAAGAGGELLDHGTIRSRLTHVQRTQAIANMTAQPGMSLKSLFVLTSIAVIFLAAISTPSPWTSAPLLAVALCTNAYGLQRLTLSPASRPFWVSYFGGVLLLVLLQVVCATSAFLDRSNSLPDPFRSTITFSMWNFVTNGEDYGSYPFNRVYQLYDLDMRIIATMTLAIVAAYAMSFFSAAMPEGDRR